MSKGIKTIMPSRKEQTEAMADVNYNELVYDGIRDGPGLRPVRLRKLLSRGTWAKERRFRAIKSQSPSRDDCGSTEILENGQWDRQKYAECHPSIPARGELMP